MPESSKWPGVLAITICLKQVHMYSFRTWPESAYGMILTWDQSLIELAQGTQVLNTDGKLFVFTRKSG
ncbi:hypothetical protein [Brevibacillus fortis]|uniref:hypothetical protein n=1 Tax=Brevibacillus TaxID=55080 RepID=UPI0038FD1C0A